jgi:hypothetical protein
MSIKTEKQQVEDLWKLVNAAEREAERYREDWDIEEDNSQYINYRADCYWEIKDPFWNLAFKLENWSDYYQTLTLTIEQSMRQFLENYVNSKPYWLADVLVKIEKD